MQRRKAQIEESVARYLHQLDSADRQDPSLSRTAKIDHLNDKVTKLKAEMERLAALEEEMLARPEQQISEDRSRCPLDGDQRPGLGHGGL